MAPYYKPLKLVLVVAIVLGYALDFGVEALISFVDSDMFLPLTITAVVMTAFALLMSNRQSFILYFSNTYHYAWRFLLEE